MALAMECLCYPSTGTVQLSTFSVRLFISINLDRDSLLAARILKPTSYVFLAALFSVSMVSTVIRIRWRDLGTNPRLLITIAAMKPTKRKSQKTKEIGQPCCHLGAPYVPAVGKASNGTQMLKL